MIELESLDPASGIKSRQTVVIANTQFAYATFPAHFMRQTGPSALYAFFLVGMVYKVGVPFLQLLGSERHLIFGVRMPFVWCEEGDRPRLIIHHDCNDGLESLVISKVFAKDASFGHTDTEIGIKNDATDEYILGADWEKWHIGGDKAGTTLEDALFNLRRLAMRCSWFGGSRSGEETSNEGHGHVAEGQA